MKKDLARLITLSLLLGSLYPEVKQYCLAGTWRTDNDESSFVFTQDSDTYHGISANGKLELIELEPGDSRFEGNALIQREDASLRQRSLKCSIEVISENEIEIVIRAGLISRRQRLFRVAAAEE